MGRTINIGETEFRGCKKERKYRKLINEVRVFGAKAVSIPVQIVPAPALPHVEMRLARLCSRSRPPAISGTPRHQPRSRMDPQRDSVTCTAFALRCIAPHEDAALKDMRRAQMTTKLASASDACSTNDGRPACTGASPPPPHPSPSLPPSLLPNLPTPLRQPLQPRQLLQPPNPPTPPHAPSPQTPPQSQVTSVIGRVWQCRGRLGHSCRPEEGVYILNCWRLRSDPSALVVVQDE